MKTLYLVGGPMGVGKTAVRQCLKRMLPNSVFLDGDWCWDADPFQVTPETKRMVLDNIVYLLNSFLHCSAYENVLFCWVMHEQAIIDTILGALPLYESYAEVHAVSLVASEEALSERIARDVETGLRDAGAIERACSYLPRYQELGTRIIDTTELSPHEVAEQIAQRPLGDR